MDILKYLFYGNKNLLQLWELLTMSKSPVLPIHTVDAVDFSSQTSGNTFGVSRVAVCYACECLLNTNLAANSVEFEITGKHYMTFLWSDCTYGQFGSTLWSAWSEKARARPSIDKTTTLIMNIWYFNSCFIYKTAVVFPSIQFLLRFVVLK